MTTYQVEVQITPWPEGGFLAEATGLQGCWVVSETMDQALDDIREVVQMWIRVRQEQCWPLPATLTATEADPSIRTILPIAVPRSTPSLPDRCVS
jgi:predicted RNase H-like HicB family nuclease